MPLAPAFKPTLLLFLALATFGCNKNHDETRPNASVGSDAKSTAQTIADFTSQDANVWVNGAPLSLTDARGKYVMLLEAWHPA